MQENESKYLWNELKKLVANDMTSHGYHMWIEPLDLIDWDDEMLSIKCPNLFSLRWINERYKALIKDSATRVSGRDMDIIFQLDKNPQPNRPSLPAATQISLPHMKKRLEAGRILKKDLTFEKFVVGECNDFAYSAAVSIATNKKRLNSPLFLISDTGLGKTHLSQAVGHHILGSTPGARVMYITTEDFTNEMVFALKRNTIGEFKEKYRKKCDVLLMEDIEFLSGKSSTQRELAYTLDYLMEAEKRLIFTSSLAPNSIPKLDESVSSRLNSSLISRMDKPDFKTRVKILKKKANGHIISKEIIEFMASELTDNVRQLESGLSTLLTKSSLLCSPINMELAAEVVKILASRKKALTISTIKDMVSRYYKVSPEDLASRSRKQIIARPRQISMYLGRRYTDLTLEAIGKSFKRRHATALHAIGVMEKHLKSGGDVKNQLEFFMDKIEKGEF